MFAIQLVLFPLCINGQANDSLTQQLNEINKRAWEIRRQLPDSALVLVKGSLQLASDHNYSGLEAESFRMLGVLAKDQGDYEQARKYYLESLKCNQNTGDLVLQARIFDNLGILDRRTGNYEEALEYHLRSLLLLDSLNHIRGKARTLNNIATTFAIQGLTEQAVEYYRKALLNHQQAADSTGMSRVFYNLGNSFFQQQELDTALFYYQQSLSLQKHLKDEHREANLYNNLGALYLERNQNQKALFFLKSSLPLHRKFNNLPSVTKVLGNLGLIYLNMGFQDSSIVHLQEGYALAQKLGLPNEESNMSNTLHIWHKEQANWSEAMFFLEHSIELKNQLYSEEWSEKTAELEQQYHAERREREITQLAFEKAQLEAEHRQKTLERNSLLVACLLVLLLGLAIGLNFWNRAKTKELIASQTDAIHQQRITQLMRDQELGSMQAMVLGQEKERQRLAEELHDRLGSMLSTVKLHMSAMAAQGINWQKGQKVQFDRAANLLDESCEEVRRIAHNLISGMLLEYGLVEALKSLANRIESTRELEIKVIASGLEKRLNISLEMGLYSIVQELISNILKHADAKEVVVQFTRHNDQLNVLVEDDGNGFHVEEALAGKGLGLKNLKHRVELLHGSWEIDSHPNRGTTVTIDLSINAVPVKNSPA